MKVEDNQEVATEGGKGNQKIWDGNFNIYWLIGTGIGVWFLFVNTPIYFSKFSNLEISADFGLHLFGAYAVYVACMWNTFHSPSHGDVYKRIHIWVGRAAMICGYVSFICGAYAAWKPTSTTSSGLAIGLTVGGVFQVISQTAGWFSIYKYRKADDETSKHRWLTSHIAFMFGLFLPACGTPAAMRLGAEFGLSLSAGLGIFITLFVCMIPLSVWAVQKKRWY